MANPYVNLSGGSPRPADPAALARALEQQRFVQQDVRGPSGSSGGGLGLDRDDLKGIAADIRKRRAAAADPMNQATAADVADRAEGIEMGSGYSPLTVGQNIGSMSYLDRIRDRFGGLFGGAGGSSPRGGFSWRE